MRFFRFQKLLIVSVFLFSLCFSTLVLPFSVNAEDQMASLIDPDDAEAQVGLLSTVASATTAVSAMYDLWCSTKEFAEGGKFECETHRQPYISSLINDLVFDTIVLFAWGQTTGEVFTKNGSPPFVISELFGMVEPESEYAQTLLHGRMPYGYTTMASATFLAFQENPPIPTNLALFIDDTFQDTMLGTPAFAANPIAIGYEYLILDAWKLSRNLALSLLGLMLAVVGVMIIFRSKIAPQVSVSIYNVLPTLPIAIALIVLSYPLISLAGSAIVPLIGWANSVGYQIIDQALPGNAVSALRADHSNSFAVVVSAALYAPYLVWEVLGRTNSITFMFWIIGALLATTLGVFHFLWTMAKIFMSLLLTTIAAPLVMVVAIIPGKQGLIMNMLKSILVDMISLPLMILGAYVAFAVIAYAPADSAAVLGIPLLGLGLAIPLIIKGFIGIGFLFSLGKIRNNLKSNLGVSGLLGGGGDSKGPPRR